MFGLTPLTTLPDLSPTLSSDRRPGILVVDADPYVLLMLEEALYGQGFDVWLALRGNDGINRLRPRIRQIDLVLLDTDMPDFHPVELMTYMRLLDNDLRFCLMGHTTSLDCRSAGVSWVFPKPFPLLEVVDILWRLARHPLGADA